MVPGGPPPDGSRGVSGSAKKGDSLESKMHFRRYKFIKQNHETHSAQILFCL